MRPFYVIENPDSGFRDSRTIYRRVRDWTDRHVLIEYVRFDNGQLDGTGNAIEFTSLPRMLFGWVQGGSTITPTEPRG